VINIKATSQTETPAPPTNTSEPVQAAELICLHVGSGPRNIENLHEAFRGPNWKELRLDLDPAVQPDIVASITDLNMLGEASVDAIWSSHNIEHLESHEVPTALAEFYRVLRPGGLLLMTLPDLQAVAKLVAEDQLEDVAYQSEAGPVSPIDILFGMRSQIAAGRSTMAHRTGFTQRTLKGHLNKAGFTNGQFWTQDLDLWALMSR
jgi:predicted SAM-dependent methyltransferase